MKPPQPVANILIILLYVGNLGFPAESSREMSMKLTNVRCKCTDPSFCKIEQCRIKSVGRNQVNGFFNASLYKRPVRNCKAIVETYYKNSVLKYQPLPINITFDACEFMENQSKRPYFKYIYDMIKNYTNLNHSCPYHEKNIWVANAGPAYHPYFDFVPEGNYLIKIKVIVDRAIVGLGQVYIERKHPTNKFDDW